MDTPIAGISATLQPIALNSQAGIHMLGIGVILIFVFVFIIVWLALLGYIIYILHNTWFNKRLH